MREKMLEVAAKLRVKVIDDELPYETAEALEIFAETIEEVLCGSLTTDQYRGVESIEGDCESGKELSN